MAVLANNVVNDVIYGVNDVIYGDQVSVHIENSVHSCKPPIGALCKSQVSMRCHCHSEQGALVVATLSLCHSGHLAFACAGC